jgi:putative component of membrane protein insertase Oxa1/YidC/SpoIIIJ protein YidD
MGRITSTFLSVIVAPVGNFAMTCSGYAFAEVDENVALELGPP